MMKKLLVSLAVSAIFGSALAQTAPTAPTVATPRPALNKSFVDNAGGAATGIQKAYKGNNGGSGGGGASSPF